MKRLRILVLALVALSGLNLESQAQDQVHLSQYMLHQPFLNPASMASYQYINGALLYRKQWVGFEGAPSVQGVNFNMPFKGRKSFLGVTVLNDQIGVNRFTDVSATYAYRIGITEKTSLSFGLSATLAMLQSDLSEVATTQDHLNGTVDPVYSSDTKTFMAPDLDFGVYYFGSRFYVGLALPSLLDNKIVFDSDYKNDIGFDFSTLHYNISGGYKFKLSDRFDLNTSALIKLVSGSPMQFDVNAQLSYNNLFGIGASYRSQQIIVAMANVKITKFFKLGYAYDYNFSELSDVSTGSHEIILIFELVRKTQPVKIDAPRF
jgi:type IX secretion system PorP/SprF family membrane protein